MEKKIEKSRKIIDYDNVEEALKHVEAILQYYDKDEKMLILRFVQQRMLQAAQKVHLNDQLHNLPFGSLVKKMMKDEQKGGE